MVAYDDVTTEQWLTMVRAVEASEILEGHGLFAELLGAAVGRAASPHALEAWREDAQVFVLGALERRPPAVDEDDQPGIELGCRRAQAGTSVARILELVLLEQRIFLESVRQILPPSPHRERMLLELFGHLQTWSSWFMIGLTSGHRGAELAMSRRSQEMQDALVWRMVNGTPLVFQDGTGIEAWGLRHQARYQAFRAKVHTEEEVEALEVHLNLQSATGRRSGLMAVFDGEACGFALTVPTQDPPVPIGVSSHKPVSELPAAFAQASRALEAVIALGRAEVASLESVGLHAAVVTDPDVGSLLHQQYIEPVLRSGDSGPAIVETVDRFVTNCGRLEPTARELGVHANTARYRLGRFEFLTSCSLREPDTLVEIWWALAWHRLGARIA